MKLKIERAVRWYRYPMIIYGPWNLVIAWRGHKMWLRLKGGR